MFNIATHNGCITIKNPIKGTHRTFRIKTARSGGLKGSRIAELMVGPDNELSYKGFGFVREDGSIILWKKFRNELFTTYANMLTDPKRWENTVEYRFEGKCRKCNRKLTNPDSIDNGIGPECAKKVAA